MLFWGMVFAWRGECPAWSGPNICLMANNFAKLQKIVRYFFIRGLKMLPDGGCMRRYRTFFGLGGGNFVVSFGAGVMRRVCFL